MVQLIKSENTNSSGIVTKSGHSISAEACQDIFLQFMAPKTSLQKNFTQNLEINFEEIEHLNSMIVQHLRGENLVALSSSVVVVHKDKLQMIFNSFDEFRGYVVGKSSPTHVVVLIYKFAIKYPESEKLQNYEVKIELTSKLTAYDLMNEDKLPSALKSLLIRVMPIVELKINYEDYLKAKAIVDVVDEWIAACPNNDNYLSKTIRLLQNYSHALPSIFASISILFIISYLTSNIVDLLPLNANLQQQFVVAIQLLGLTYIIVKISKGVGGFIENFLNFYPFLSFIKINKGDQNLITQRSRKLVYVALQIFGVIVLGAIGSYVMAVICGLFPSLLPN